MIGTILDEKYRIERLLGQGGMGAVYVGEDVRTRERVAVKVMHAHLASRVPDIAQRFAREARAAGAIDTEHIARCIDAGTDRATEQPYMVLELLSGDDFDRVLRSIGPVDPDLALRITAQAALGLGKAHQANIVHRDIKPANLFLATRPGTVGERVVKILDFGVAKILDENDDGAGHDGLTRTGSLLGSPLYMSPEQARSVKKVDPRTDVWSLGVVLYKGLAGRTPFEHVSGLGDLVLALWNETPTPVQTFAPWVSPEIAAILDRMLRAEPGERFQSMAEVYSAIEPLLPGGVAIHESMLAPLSPEAKKRTAQTFFRRLDTRQPVRAVTAQPPPSLEPAALRPSSESGERSAPINATQALDERAASSGLGGAPQPAARDLTPAGARGGAPAPHDGLVSSAVTGPAATHNGLVTTDPGARRSETRVVSSPAGSPWVKRAAAIAFIALAAGIGVVVVALRGSRPEPPGVTPAAEPPSAAIERPFVTPGPSGAAPAASAPPSSTAAAPASATVPPTPVASASATAPAPQASTARPRTTATPPATTAPATTSKSPGFTDFGDRK